MNSELSNLNSKWQKSLKFTLFWLNRPLNSEKYLDGTLKILTQIEIARIKKLESDKFSDSLVLPYTCKDGFTVLIELLEPDLNRIIVNKNGQYPRQFIRTEGGQPYDLPLLIQHTAHAIKENRPISNWDSLPKVLSNITRDHGRISISGNSKQQHTREFK